MEDELVNVTKCNAKIVERSKKLSDGIYYTFYYHLCGRKKWIHHIRVSTEACYCSPILVHDKGLSFTSPTETLSDELISYCNDVMPHLKELRELITNYYDEMNR